MYRKMLKNLHRPKKLVIFTLVKGDAIYHANPNNKTGNTYTYRRKKEKNLLRRHRMHLRHNSTTHRRNPVIRRKNAQ